MSKKRPSSAKKTVTTKSGRTLKVNQSLGQKWIALKADKARRKVDRLKGLPKSRVRRLLWHVNPSHIKEYWFSRDGGIMALKLTGIGILALFLLTLAIFAYFRKDLPKITDISGDNLGGSISYYDRTGQTLLWQDYNAVKRTPCLNDCKISPYLKNATVAVEDRDFYKHRGFDIRGIVRAAVNDLVRHGSTQGGSTITQQLVKLTQDFNQNRSIAKKIKETILAVELERTYTKDQILTGYLNAAPYGGVDYGVKAASQDYFHVDPKDLTLGQAAMLASIPKSPTYYSPYSGTYFNKQAFLDRQHYILDQMVSQHMISKAQADNAKKEDVLAEVHPQSTKYAGIQSPYFVLAAKDQLQRQFVPSDGNGSAKIGGWKITTTMDVNLQQKAEQLVQQNLPNARRHGADEEAVVAEDVKTGQMVALVGGTDFNDPDHGAINYAQWNISPGSSFKPYDYASLIDNTTNSGAGSVLYDVQQPLPGYSCTDKGLPPPKGTGNCLQDYDFRYPGALTLRYALGGSRNVPAVKAMLTVGTDKVISIANSMMNAPGAYKCFNPGVDVNTATSKDISPCYGASAIGDGAYLHLDQHVNGLATMGRLGQEFPQTYILKIQNSGGKTIYQWKQPKTGDSNVKQVVRQDAAYIVDNMASDPNASYLPAGYYKWHRYNGWQTAVKTGTTNNGFDGLMMGWNTQYAVGSWVGYHTRNKALSGTMETLTTPLTKGLMTYALDSLHTNPVNWTEPSDLKHLPAFVVRTHVGVGSVEPSPSTDIFPSWYQPKGSTQAQAQTMDKVSNKLATSCTPGLAKQVVGGSAPADSLSSDIFYNSHGPVGGGSAGSAAATTESDDVHNCSDQTPSINLTVTDSSGQATTNCNATCTFVATASQGTHQLSDPQYSAAGGGYINFIVNGQQVSQQAFTDTSSTTQKYVYSVTSAGQITVSAQVIDSVLYEGDSNSVTVTAKTTTTYNNNAVTTASATRTIKRIPAKHGH